MGLIEITPTSRVDQLTKIVGLTGPLTSKQLALLQAGPGSGKSRCIANVSKEWIKEKDKYRLFVVVPDEHIVDQHKKELEAIGFKVLDSLDPRKNKIWDSGDLFDEMERYPLVALIFSGVHLHNSGKLSKEASLLTASLKLCKRTATPVLIQIDEFHKQLTGLTGGINSTFYHSSDKMENHKAIVRTNDSGLNLFDYFRACGATVMGWSATLHNIIGSKSYSMGYDPKETILVVAEPLPDLYSNREFIPFDIDSPEDYLEMMFLEEKRGKILLIFSSIDNMHKFKRDYKKFAKHAISATEITYRTKYTDEQLIKSLMANQYVLGVMSVSTGFDLASKIGENFKAIFIFRDFSDRASTPTSTNINHDLYCEISASLAQAAGRARDADCNIYTSLSHIGVSPLSIHQEFSKLAKKAVEYPSLYGPPATTQIDRQHAGIYVSLCQNLTAETGIIATNVLTFLEQLTGRDLKQEFTRNDCDHLFWRSQIAILWEILSEDAYTDPDSVKRKIDKYVTMIKRAGCVGDERVMSADLKDRLLEITGNRCGHCSVKFAVTDEIVFSHCLAHSEGGVASINNGFPAHPHCNTAHDSLQQLLDIERPFYWIKNHESYPGKPLLDAVNNIDPSNILGNWQVARKKLELPIEFSDEKVREWLIENGYTRADYST